VTKTGKTREGRDGERGGLPGRVWRSIVRGPLRPRSDRERKWIALNNLVLHFRPLRLPARTLRTTHTWGLGGMSLLLILMLAATGVLLMFVYEPFPGRAYDSVTGLQTEVLFGKLVRNIHHWSANLLILVVVFHLLRVFFTGGFHGPRQFNWVLGLGLLLCVVVSNFTGYLLPWDQLSYWAITICTAMLGYVPWIGEWLQGVAWGGPEIGMATLRNFYTIHTTIVPVFLVVLLPFHFWRIRKAKGVVLPRSPGEEPDEKPETVLALPNLLLREFVVALCLLALVLVLAVLVDAPLGAEANPGMSPNPAKAPWYFMGFQELLLHFHPLVAVVAIPFLAAVLLLLLPYWRYDADTAGVWFASRKGRRMGAIAAVSAMVLTPVLVLLDEFWIDLSSWPAAAALLAAVAAFHILLKKGFSASRNEAVQTTFVLLAVAFAVLTLTGVWFRGEGMALAWPWGP